LRPNFAIVTKNITHYHCSPPNAWFGGFSDSKFGLVSYETAVTFKCDEDELDCHSNVKKIHVVITSVEDGTLLYDNDPSTPISSPPADEIDGTLMGHHLSRDCTAKLSLLERIFG
jgi:hypothetical protein